MNSPRNNRQSIDSKVLSSIRRRGRGAVFIPADFLHLGSREAIDTALRRLTRSGTVRRLTRGVYDYPEDYPVLELLQPSSEAVARALTGRYRTRLQPAEAYAANVLGLSEHVPAKAMSLTDGQSPLVQRVEFRYCVATQCVIDGSARSTHKSTHFRPAGRPSRTFHLTNHCMLRRLRAQA